MQSVLQLRDFRLLWLGQSTSLGVKGQVVRATVLVRVREAHAARQTFPTNLGF